MSSGECDESLIQLTDVQKAFGGRTVLNGVNLTVNAGECVALLGANGAGKSTTLSIALGLGKADVGSARLLGLELPRLGHQARAEVGVVPQFDGLDPDFSVFENLLVFGRYFHIESSDLCDRAVELAKFAGLESRLNDSVESLSGGMKRRLVLARALINRPRVLFLDEPTTGLDPQARHFIWQSLLQLKQTGIALLLTSHDMEETQKLADRVAVLDGGKIVACDRPSILVRSLVGQIVLEMRGLSVQDFAANRLSHLKVAETRGAALLYRDENARMAMKVLEEESPQGIDCIMRPANLEDVYFNLTGKALQG